jgi:hypothetical protein
LHDDVTVWRPFAHVATCAEVYSGTGSHAEHSDSTQRYGVLADSAIPAFNLSGNLRSVFFDPFGIAVRHEIQSDAVLEERVEACEHQRDP